MMRVATLCLTLVLVSSGIASAQTTTDTVDIDLTQDFKATKIKVTKGELIDISADGDMDWYTKELNPPGCPPGFTCHDSPDGRPWDVCKNMPGPFPAPELNCWSLIGRIGEHGDPFQVGKTKTFCAGASGTLYLGVNDSYRPDNTGKWTARIATRPGFITYFIGGLFDEEYQNVKSYFDNRQLPDGTTWAKSPCAYYRSWTDGSVITDEIKHLPRGTMVNLVGHSFGGDTAAKVAIAVNNRTNLLVTIDPVFAVKPDYPNTGKLKSRDHDKSYDEKFFKTTRAHVRTWVDVNATGGEILTTDCSKIIPYLGGKWGSRPRPDSIPTYKDEPFDHCSFGPMMTEPMDNGSSPQQMLLDSLKW